MTMRTYLESLIKTTDEEVCSIVAHCHLSQVIVSLRRRVVPELVATIWRGVLAHNAVLGEFAVQNEDFARVFPQEPFARYHQGLL